MTETLYDYENVALWVVQYIIPRVPAFTCRGGEILTAFCSCAEGTLCCVRLYITGKPCSRVSPLSPN